MRTPINRFKNLYLLILLFAANIANAQEKPNILFIIADDLGKEWVSSYGAEEIKTPSIDKLAQTGLKFENFYSAPQCTPSRVELFTGQYPFRNGWVNHWDVPRWGGGAHFDWNKNPSIARIMQSAGYKIAAAGKWQVNDFRVQPEAMVYHGFDDYCMWTGFETGNPASAERYWNPVGLRKVVKALNQQGFKKHQLVERVVATFRSIFVSSAKALSNGALKISQSI